MKASDPDVFRYNSATNIGNHLGSNLSNLLIVVLMGLQSLKEFWRNDSLSQRCCSHETVPSLNRIDAWYDRNSDACCPNGLDPINEHIHVVEHLGENEVDTDVNLLLEILHLEIAFCWRQELGLRKASNCNIEVIAIVLADVLDEIDAVFEASFYRLPFVLSSRRIASQCENVSTTVCLCVLGSCLTLGRSHKDRMTHPQCIVHLLSRHVGAGQMHACFYPNKTLTSLDEL